MPNRPECPDCGHRLSCTDCDDSRPIAEDLSAGWRLRSPFGRWETVTATEQMGRFGPVLIYTEQAGPHHPWEYLLTERVTAREPENKIHGLPEVRVVESPRRDGPMIAYACNSGDRTGQIPSVGKVLAQAWHQPGQGWQVGHRHPPGAEPTISDHPSKAKARTALKAVARTFALQLKAQLTVVAPD